MHFTYLGIAASTVLVKGPIVTRGRRASNSDYQNTHHAEGRHQRAASIVAKNLRSVLGDAAQERKNADLGNIKSNDERNDTRDRCLQDKSALSFNHE